MDAQDLIPAVYDLAFVADEDVVSIGEEDGFRLPGLVREAIELQRNRRWWRRLRRKLRRRCNHHCALWLLDGRCCLLLEDIASTPLIQSLFAVLQKVSAKRRIKR